jgi:hypothetical protein
MMSSMRTTLTLDDDVAASRSFHGEVFRSRFRPGVDPLKLNQLGDELEARRFPGAAPPRS